MKHAEKVDLARDRVRRFIDEWPKMQGNDPDLIHGIWRTIDGEDVNLILTVADLRLLVDAS